MHIPERHHQWLVRIQPRREKMYVSQGRAVLATDRGGVIAGDPVQGFFVHETRVLSKYRYEVNGVPPLMIAGCNVEQHSWLGYYGFAPPGFHWRKDTGSGSVEPVSQQTIELRVSRLIGLGAHEDIDFTDFTQQASEFVFEIEVAADFADQAETSERQQHGKLKQSWKQVSRRLWELVFDYRAQHRYSHQGDKGKAKLHRSLIVQIENPDSPPVYKNGRIRFTVKLQPRGTWHTCIKLTAIIDGQRLPPLYGCREFFGQRNVLDRNRQLFLTRSTKFETPGSGTLSNVVVDVLEQSKRDLAALRLHDLDHGAEAWTMAAGLPIYIAFFGRDTLTASWQSALAGVSMMKGTLPELARRQGTRIDDWRDEEPGKMLHEAHTGPLAALCYNPRWRYYGAATTSSFYPVVLTELWNWTGDKSLVRPLISPALKALRWKDKYTQLRDDGFYYYLSRSEQGNKHQGWKDSGDAIVDEDGNDVDAPVATCEEQAFVYVAKVHMSAMMWWMGEPTLARQLFREAEELKKRFNEKFWMPDKNFYALGLDSRGQPIKSIASNPGHLLACGIVEQYRALDTARRLLAPDLFTGWGIRTLSSDHPAFDPYSYHRGAVWPVEHGSFALGFMRYGLHQELHALLHAMFEATTLFDFHRLPECFSGHQRDREHPFPALYPKTNWPQAWSASCIFSFVQSLLGIYPFAPMNILLLDPQLPDWLPEITLRDLRIGKAVASIRFYRRGKNTQFEVLEQRGKLHIIRQPSPWSLTATLGERLKDVLASLAA
ncbi:MAG TPA: glycogen debranching N-terminal domain-containing protein [Terriglobales bacterium]|nr:glycogen debranching N-terminal domain-containing protein [Terriglobales bacterium]